MKVVAQLFVCTLLAGVTLGAASAQAKNFTIGDPPVAVIALPDAWGPEEIENGAEATAPGPGAYVAAEAVKIKDVAAATREGIRFFQKSGVEIDPSTQTQKDDKLNGYPSVDISWSGKDKDGPTHVSLTFVVMSDTQSVLLYLWGSDDDLKAAAPQLKAIAASLRKVN